MRSTIKTAISIDVRTFRKVERLAHRLKISRSQFFSQAAKHMIERDENLDLLRRINAAYEQDETEKNRRAQERTYTRDRLAEEW